MASDVLCYPDGTFWYDYRRAGPGPSAAASAKIACAGPHGTPGDDAACGSSS